MPIDFLLSLQQAGFPLTVTEPEAVKKVEMLLLAQLVQGRLDKAGVYSEPYAATVDELTPAGLALLRRLEARTKP